MDQSILTSTKKVLGLAEDYTAFDEDVIMHINSAFGTLNQLGIGPDGGFSIEDDSALWTSYITDADPSTLSMVKTYVFLRVRYLFDPPTTSYLLAAVNDQLNELVFRINVNREDAEWTPGVENG